VAWNCCAAPFGGSPCIGGIREAFRGATLGGHYGAGRLVLLVIARVVVGARRLEHLRYLAPDPLVARFARLAPVPTDRTVATWLSSSPRPRPQSAAQLPAPGAATPKPRSRKRTYAFALRSMRTLRFLLIARAGGLARIDGR
jgi:hypothetical protein